MFIIETFQNEVYDLKAKFHSEGVKLKGGFS